MTPMPTAPDAELALLGLLIERPDDLDRPEVWGADLLVSPTIRRALEALRTHREGGGHIDLVSVEGPLRRSGIAGWGTLVVDADQQARGTVLAAVLRTLHEVAYLRRLWRMGEALMRAVDTLPLTEIPATVDCAIAQMTAAGPAGLAVVPIGLREGLTAHVDVIAGRAAHPLTGWATGFRTLDGILRGLQPGELSVIAARPSVGKSALAHQLALAIGEKPTGSGHVLICSPEMSRSQIFDRFAAMIGDVAGGDIAAGKLGAAALALLRGRIQALQTTITVQDDAVQTTGSIGGWARRQRSDARRGLDLLIVDHLGFLNHEQERGESRAVYLGRLTKRLKALGRQLGCHVCLLAQLNRGSEEGTTMRRPGLADLRDSGEIEQDADVVLLLHRETREAYAGELVVAKNRQGPTGLIPMRWEGTTTTWSEA